MSLFLSAVSLKLVKAQERSCEALILLSWWTDIPMHCNAHAATQKWQVLTPSRVGGHRYPWDAKTKWVTAAWMSELFLLRRKVHFTWPQLPLPLALKAMWNWLATQFKNPTSHWPPRNDPIGRILRGLRPPSARHWSVMEARRWGLDLLLLYLLNCRNVAQHAWGRIVALVVKQLRVC